MEGLMMGTQLLVSSLLRNAAQNHATTEIVSRSVEGPIHRYGYAELERRARRLASALKASASALPTGSGRLPGIPGGISKSTTRPPARGRYATP